MSRQHLFIVDANNGEAFPLCKRKDDWRDWYFYQRNDQLNDWIEDRDHVAGDRVPTSLFLASEIDCQCDDQGQWTYRHGENLHAMSSKFALLHGELQDAKRAVDKLRYELDQIDRKASYILGTSGFPNDANTQHTPR